MSMVCSVRTQSIFCYFGGPNFENYLPIFLEIDTKMTNEDRTQMSVPTCNTCDYTFTGQFGCEKDYIFTPHTVIFPGEMGMYIGNFCSHSYSCSSLGVHFCCSVVSCFEYKNPAGGRTSNTMSASIRNNFGDAYTV